MDVRLNQRRLSALIDDFSDIPALFLNNRFLIDFIPWYVKRYYFDIRSANIYPQS